MENEKLKLPELDEVKRGIEQLLLVEKWDKYKIKTSPKKFKKQLNELFFSKLSLIPTPLLLSNQKSFPFSFYRLRKKTKFMNEKLISEYSYPPNHVVKSVQRANIPYHPVFYCSDNPATAIFETIRTEERLNKEAVYYLSEWVVRSNEDLKICPFLFGNVHEGNPFKEFSEICVEKIRDVFKGYSSSQIEGVIEIMNFVSNLFTYDNSYVVSSYLAHSAIYQANNYRPDIFIYPSVQTDRKSVNFAVHPNTVSQKLLLKKVYKLRIDNFNKKDLTFNAHFSHYGQNKDGIIFWNEMNKDRPQEGLEDFYEKFGFKYKKRR